jgi:preprotein translocase subunit SecG
MQETILIIYLVVAIALVGIILIQQGKGAEMGASFGAGGANTVFGAAGSGNALTKATTILAILFFGIALSISYLNSTPIKVVDAVFDEAPAVEKIDIESALPESNEATGLEAELPPTGEAAKEVIKDAVETADKAATEVSEKVEEVKQAASADETEETKKGDDQ